MKKLLLLSAISVVAVVLSPISGVEAAVNTCQARNLTQGTAGQSDLQVVIEAASPDDTIQVKRVCVGNFRITKDLTLVGEPTDGIRRPVLDGDGAGPVVTVFGQTRVTLINLKITGGDSQVAGGIANLGRLTLERSAVVGNTSEYDGGGIYNDGGAFIGDGRLILRDSTVRSNTALIGGGISNYGRRVVLIRSSVINNVAYESAGGIANDLGSFVGELVLRNSVVRGNKAYVDGGGIQNFWELSMYGSSLVTGNRADYDNDGGGTGGGIDNCGTLTGVTATNVRDNYLGSSGTREDNVSPCL